MKLTYNGKHYDTDTATKLLYHCNDAEGLYFVSEHLYITPEGDYFLSGHGGAYTHYSKNNSDGSISAGDGICPLIEQEMEIWVYDRIGPEKFSEFMKSLDNIRCDMI